MNFIQLGAQDPAVVSIKQTLYRTSQDSPLFQAFIEAAATKEATVVVELMARFDEASNIRWARSMEDAGVQVFHGVVGLKTHCKLALLVRRDEDGVTRRYCHLGTGNYNPMTARFYTDLSLLTSDAQITERVHTVFNYLTAHAEVDDYRPLLVAPLTMAESFLGLIRREADHARAGRPAHIVAKMNALLEPSVIEALYQASQAGVEIDLIIRGISIIRPGVKGLSDNVRVRSIVGRFLEHSRIFHFANGGDDEIYLGSADWMPRNLFERCEVVFPGARRGGQGAHPRRDSAGVPGRQREGAHSASGREISPRQQVQQGRAGVLRAGFPDAACGRKDGPRGDSGGGRAGDAAAAAEEDGEASGSGLKKAGTKGEGPKKLAVALIFPSHAAIPAPNENGGDAQNHKPDQKHRAVFLEKEKQAQGSSRRAWRAPAMNALCRSVPRGDGGTGGELLLISSTSCRSTVANATRCSRRFCSASMLSISPRVDEIFSSTSRDRKHGSGAEPP